ncbi:MAG: preprotein translocase subunit SecB [Rhodospirillaceae bacterium]|nr:MAG: preprotein translocase subunit SecB [Rhodospirillaceae bacterium]
MSEHTSDETANAPLVIHGQYIKDLSFEVPNAPAVFQGMQVPPTVSVQVDINARPLQLNMFEVTLNFHIKGMIQDKVAFILELTYAAVASLNVPQEHVQPVAMIELPRLLFPFARAIIADVSRDSGFPPLMIALIDFVSLYRQRLEGQKQAIT